MDPKAAYNQASIKTATALRTVAQSVMIQELSRLSLPEVEKVVEVISNVIPAGNVPGVILSGLARIPDRKPPKKILKRDVNLLFSAMEQFVDKAMYGAVFAGPAAVIWGYQNLLKLAGKDPEDAFPQGTWQFYIDYALRDDTARHTNETHGFDTLLNKYNVQLGVVDRVTAWVMAAIHCLHQYDGLIANEWRERVYTTLLMDLVKDQPEAKKYAKIYRDWEAKRPYGRGADAGELTYAAYRRQVFDRFLVQATQELPTNLREEWQRRTQTAEAKDLPAYQQQMSILAYLDPGPYGETRTPIALRDAHIGVIHKGIYFLVPACLPGTDQPADVHTVREEVMSILSSVPQIEPHSLVPLAQLKRTALPGLRGRIQKGTLAELDLLRTAPILFNADPRPLTNSATGKKIPLSQLRLTERGIGDHPLTIFDTRSTILLDQSHIFFDGALGAALAEILTNEALSWAVYLASLPTAQPAAQPAPQRPRVISPRFRPEELDAIRSALKVTTEAAAETEAVKIKPMLALRKIFKQRNDLIQLTVNDLLVLYRAIHAATYQPDENLLAALQACLKNPSTRSATQAALDAINSERKTNPAVLIPVDASQRSPRDRLYPMNFEVPLTELNLIELHQQTVAALQEYKTGSGNRAKAYTEFDRLQRLYLATLAGFGSVMSKAKEIALTGESASVGTIKMLAHMPTPLQRMLETIPSRFDMLNDLIKGREVFSNVGSVVPTSTLTRFITAKDDNEKKTLAWGIITDASGVMRVSLRDFRPHVALLQACGQKELADWIAQDYLDAYASGLNRFVVDVQRITMASRETRMATMAERNL